MNRKLGIDLGENSIGWALIEGNEIRESRVRLFPSQGKATTLKKTKPLFAKKVKSLLKKSSRI